VLDQRVRLIGFVVGMFLVPLSLILFVG